MTERPKGASRGEASSPPKPKRNALKACEVCEEQFPPHLIQPLMVNGGYFPMCPICALAATNEIHGLPAGTPFRGEMAQAAYDEAEEWLSRRSQ